MTERTNNGLTSLAEAERDTTSEISVGTGTTNPTPEDDALSDEVFRKEADSVVTGTGRVRHTMRLLSGEANGNALTEAGVLDDDDRLTGRSVFAQLDKTPDNEVEVRYVSTTTRMEA